MSLKFILIAAIGIPILLWAFLADTRSWHKKSEEELRAMAGGNDWRPWQPSIKELKRRGLEFDSYRKHYLNGLLAETPKERAGAHIVLMSQYPDLEQRLKNFRTIGGPDNAKILVKELIAELDEKESGTAA